MELLQLQKIKTSPKYMTPQFWTLLTGKKGRSEIILNIILLLYYQSTNIRFSYSLFTEILL